MGGWRMEAMKVRKTEVSFYSWLHHDSSGWQDRVLCGMETSGSLSLRIKPVQAFCNLRFADKYFGIDFRFRGKLQFYFLA